jgi:hypothetical protein
VAQPSKHNADPNIDVVILAFVISQLNGGPYPTVNFGAACGGQTAEMLAEAPGLLYCPELASYIKACQSTYGKKVMLSIGGAASQFSLASADAASTLATTLWNLFGPPGDIGDGLRPFGQVSIDEFDVGAKYYITPFPSFPSKKREEERDADMKGQQTKKTTSPQTGKPSPPPCAPTTALTRPNNTTSLPRPNVLSPTPPTHPVSSCYAILCSFNSTIIRRVSLARMGLRLA